MKNKKYFILGIILVVVLSLTLVSAASVYSRQSVAYTPTFVPFTGEPQFPLFDRTMCEAGQDFILQVSPLGCTPSVVRSDLLEDQNVPIFCPITAIQINPLIDVESIDQIFFRGEYPREVQGISYLPARAALGRYGSQVNNPVLDNIGYAIIVLKQQKNSSAMPDFVEGNLTARIKYDIKNAFGVGKASFYLPELKDEEWENTFTQYSFWDGRGYLRAEEIDEDSAFVSIYSDRQTSGFGSSGEKRKLSTVNLKVGEESREMSMPGFDYCIGSMRLRLNGLESPDTRVRLNVNGDIVEVKEREKFLDNKCQVRDIEKQGITEKITIRCDEDDGRDTFPLSISPRVTLNIDNVPKDYGVGDRLYQEADGEKTVYLVYVGTKTNSANEKDLFVITAAIPGTKSRLSEDELSSIAGFLNRFPSSEIKNIVSVTFNVFKAYSSSAETILRYILDGQTFRELSFGETKEISGKSIEITGFAGAQDLALEGDFKKYYEKAIEDYDSVIDSFSSEKYPQTDENQITLGEKALTGKIELAWAADQKRTVAEFCEEFVDSYGSIEPSICNEAYKLSSPGSTVEDVQINGRIKRISFDGIREPTFDEFGASILVKDPQGNLASYEFRKNHIIYLNESTNEFIQLVDVDKNSVKIKVSLKKSTTEAVRQFVLESDTKTLKFGFPDRFGSDYLFTLHEANLKKMAKVSVIPNIRYSETSATFPFKIGIEKRGIQLSPEKTKEKIESLNQTLEKWGNINDKLGGVVKGLKTACLGVGTVLTVKNFFANLGGEGIARNKVMRGEGGWFEKCQDLKNRGDYVSVDSCLLDNSDAIDSTVDERLRFMKVQNEELERLQESCKIDDGFLGEDIINTDCLTADLVDSSFRSELSSNLAGKLDTIKVNNEGVDVSDIISEINENTTFLTQARDLQLNARLLNSNNPNVREIALAQMKADLGDIWVNSERDREKKVSIDLLSKIGLSGIGLESYAKKNAVEGIYDGYTTPSGGAGQIPGKVSVKAILYGGNLYILQLEKVGPENYRVVEVYDENKIKQPHDSDIYGEIQGMFTFKKFDRTTYENTFINPEIRYFETDPYRGLPAIVPFDLKNGWYAAIKSNLPIGGGLRAFDDSGRVSNFYLCNVGKDGKAEFNSGIGDDICRGFVPAAGQPPVFPGIKDASGLMERAKNAIAKVSKEYRSGVSGVIIEGKRIPVGEPAVDIPDIQCQDFMSPSECNLLFNVCDPVVCPSSRCDLGGAYPVKDVVQSGIVGSLALCLPNFPEVKIPVCLSGIHAGIDGYLSVVDSYQQCLQTSLETGQTVGICDEIYSIHMCEFFWRQGVPIAKIAIPKIIGSVLGQDVRGGGEYLGVQDAWQKASDSVDYFSQYYAANSYKAFKARTAEGVGTEVCKNWVSFTGPQGGDLLDALTAPDSPPQFYGRFDEIPFTTATNPPISHYKVFYHIYAGKDLPAHFQVYLKGTGGSFYQDASFRRIVAQGFITAGEYATDTPDFTAPSGYQEMCIVVNGQEECGFKQVTTDFGINYITEQYVASQAAQTDIKTETACVSGTPNIFPLLNPNLQAGAEEAINPAIYNRGITRICSTDDPGKGTDSLAGTVDARWVEVGYCGNPRLKCWLDEKSVRDTIRNTDIESKVIKDTTQNYVDALKQELGYVENFGALVEEIEGFGEDNIGKIEKINENYDRVFYSYEKGHLTFLRADAYAKLASGVKPESEPVKPEDPDETTLEDIIEKGKQIIQEEEKAKISSYPIFLFEDGTLFVSDLYYRYSEGGWFWSYDESDWNSMKFAFVREDIEGATPADVSGVAFLFDGLPEKNQQFIIGLKTKSYSQGLRLLIGRTIKNDEGFLGRDVRLSAEIVDFSPDKKFKINIRGIVYWFEYSDGQGNWRWSFNEKIWMNVPETVIRGSGLVNFEGTEPIQEVIDLIKSLEGESFYTGAKIIFGEFSGAGFSGTSESEETVTETCSTREECRRVIGEKIIELARAKEKPGMDADVKADTGANSFECLVLQIAYTESNIAHCRDPEKNGNPLYCDGNVKELITGDEFKSLGVMQINKDVHGEKLFFEENVNYAIDLLVRGHRSSGKIYNCYRPIELKSQPVRESDFQPKTYSGWQIALRSYNGWNSQCLQKEEDDSLKLDSNGNPILMGNPNYVDDVMDYKDNVEALFPAECGS